MTLGIMATDVEQRIDFDALRAYKLQRVRDQLEEKDLGALLCLDMDNIRYVTSTRLAEWARDKFIRWCVLPRGGEPVLFELGSAAKVKRELSPWLKPENIRVATPWARGAILKVVNDLTSSNAARNIKAVLEENGVADMPIGVDTVDLYLLEAMRKQGLDVVNGWDAMWDARVIKSPEELQIIEISAALVDGVYAQLVDFIKPGIKENEIVAKIQGWLIDQGVDRITGVNCVSGPRSNPHPHDYSDRMIRPGDLVFIDIISHFLGYATCYYRTFAVTRSTQKQRDLYKQALEWLERSIEAVRPGATTADIAEQWPSAEALGYENEIEALGLQVGHGVGLSNHEKPIITRAVSLAMPAPIEAGMHFALETFAGDGDDGARIESQVVVTEKGHEVITKWPCDELMVCNPR
jgi:Xaa-Pro aminopeptidase